MKTKDDMLHEQKNTVQILRFKLYLAEKKLASMLKETTTKGGTDEAEADQVRK